MPPRSLSLRDLRTACATLETSVLQKQRATAEQIALAKPGQPANADTGPQGWLRFYGQLRIWQDKGQDAPEPVGPSTDTLLTAAITDEPKAVRLSVLDDQGGPRIVHCYPKSRRALLHLHARDIRAGHWMEQYRKLQATKAAGDSRLLKVAEEVDYQIRCLVWAVTTEGPWLPFDPREIVPELPPWLSLLTPEDGVRILLAHHQVNHARLALLGQLLGSLTPSEHPTDPSLMGWGAFLARASDEMGLAYEVLDRDRSLGSVLGGVYVQAKAAERMRETAGAT